MSLKNQVALITGAGRNVGKDSVRELVSEGANLALHYESPGCMAVTLRFRDEVINTGADIKISLHGGDLGSATGIDKLFADVLAEHKRVDVLVNSSGMVIKKPSDDTPSSESDKLFAYAVFVDEQRRRTVDQLHEEAARLSQT